MNRRDLTALKHYAENGPGPLPHGCGTKTRYNLLHRKWIIQTTGTDDLTNPYYELTPTGRDQLNSN